MNRDEPGFVGQRAAALASVRKTPRCDQRSYIVFGVFRRSLAAVLLAIGSTSSLAFAEEPAAAIEDSTPDYRDQLPRLDPVEPDKALGKFEVRPPFRMELVASEPVVHDPVAMAFDADARLYVVEMRGYSEQRDEKLGAVRLLEDADNDGRFEKSTLFADELRWPVAVACWNRGVFVGDPPDVWYMKDTDGDHKADIRRRVLTGFSHGNVQAMLNTFVWGLDNRIYCTTSTGGAKVRRVAATNEQPLTLRTRDFAFDPRTMEIAVTSVGGQHGMSFDDWGRKFVCTNSNHIMQVLYDDRYIARNPYLAAPASRILIAADGSQPDVFRVSPLEPWRILRTKLRLEGTLMQFRLEGGGRPAGYFTAASGVTVYRGDNWPAEYRGAAVVGDVGSNLIHLMRLEPNGLEFVAHRIGEKTEFVASRDTWFRPVQFANGPDGRLYVADMYREIIEHPDSFGDVIKKHLHLTSGRDRGRIYRIGIQTNETSAPGDSSRRVRPRSLTALETSELVALLAHPNAWHRETSARLLFERQDLCATGPLRRLVRESDSPLGRMHALYALSGLQSLRSDDVLHGLADDHPRVRQHAVRLAEHLLDGSQRHETSDEADPRASSVSRLGRRLLAMADDPDIGVRYQLAFSLGECKTRERLSALARIARRDAGDRWMRTAVLSSLNEGGEEVFGELVADRRFRGEAAAREMLAQMARLSARRNRPDAINAIVDSLGSLGNQEEELAVAIVRGLGQGIGGRQRVLAEIMKAEAPTPGGQRFRQIVQGAARIANDPAASVGQRVDAVELLRLSPLEDVRPALVDLLDSRQPREVGEAALAVLDRMRDPHFAELVVNTWQVLSPGMRATAMEHLVRRPERAPVLLDAVERGKLNSGDLTARQIQRVCLHKDEKLRERAIRLLSPSRPGKRADVIAAYESTLDQSGNAARGRDVFRKTCVACHKAEGVGHDLGPNLVTFKHRGPEAILASVLDPNRELNPQYATYLVHTRDGRVLTGMITAETPTSITLTREEGKHDTVLRNEIEALRGNNISLMPEGLEKDIDQQSMADLIAYLMTLD